MTHRELRTEAEKLRRAGYSYNMIYEKIGISKGTLSAWLSEVEYSPNRKVKKRIENAILKIVKTTKAKKKKSQEDAIKIANTDVGVVESRDLFMLGLAIYIGEGKKTGNPGVVNADERIIQLSIDWFRKFFGIRNSQFRLSIHLYPDNNIEECLSFWRHKTGIPENQFGKTQIDRRKDKKVVKKGKLRYGTAHLVVLSLGNPKHGAFLRRRIRAQMDKVLLQKKRV